MRVIDSAGRLKTAYGGVLGTSDGQIPENIGGVMTGVPLPNNVFDFRLTPTTGVPVITADSAATTNLFLAPFKGSRLALYDGTRWVIRTSAQMTLALGTVVPYQAYDVFVYDNAGVPTLEKLAWANATVTMTIASPCVVTWTAHGMSNWDSITFTTSGALPTGVAANTQYFVTVVDANTFKLSTSRINLGAGTYINTSGTQSGTHTGHQPQDRATALTTQDGVLVKSGDATRRYVGTFVATTTTQTQCTFGGTTTQVGGKWLVYNYYHQQPFALNVFDGTANWSYATATWRPMNGTEANHVEFILGQVPSELDLHAMVEIVCDATEAGSIAIGINAINDIVTGTPVATPRQLYSEGTIAAAGITVVLSCEADWQGRPPVGWHAAYPLERVRTGTLTYWGGAADNQQGGLIARILA